MTPEQITAATITEAGVVTLLADQLIGAAQGSIDFERGSSASLTIKIKRDKDRGKLELIATVKASYPTSETETTTIKAPAVTLCTITTDHPGQTRLDGV
jgi:hypothetical protein